MRKNIVEIKENSGGILALYHSRGNVFAIRYAGGSEVTEEEIRKIWREERRAFRPYDTSAASFCD